jgi:hypothetical protein
MPLRTVNLLPGQNVEQTALLDEAIVNSAQLIRWKYAAQRILPEKLGGWAKFYLLGFGSPVRALHAWEGINADRHLAAGCELSLEVVTNGSAQDITPRILITNPAVNFSTTVGNATVTVVDAGITTTVYDSIFLNTPVSVGGIVLYGEYQVKSVVSSSSYTIAAASNATSTVANGGAVPSFATTMSSFVITVTLNNHTYSVGDIFPVKVSTTVGGVVLSGSYVVQSVPNSNTFTINAASVATSTTSSSENGGNAQIEYFIAVSPQALPAGYGLGGYGTGGYGIGVSPSPSPGQNLTTTNWTLDNWGEVLIACPTDGAIYTWAPDTGFANATKLLTAPLINGGIFVSNTTQILVAWASSTNGVQDPLLVQWSASGDYTDWTPTTINQAGNFRIPSGSRIVGGIAGPQFNIIWTDLDVWSMDYIQLPFVYGFNNLATNCGLIARHAQCVVNATVLWMGQNQFFALNGETVTPIPCSVWDFVFQDLDTNNLDKICAAPNNGFGEVTWFFPSASGGTGEIDSYVKVNFTNGFIWDAGRLQRTAWIDQSVLGQPIGGDAGGYIYQHEISPDADGQPMTSWFQTGFFKIAEGEDLSFLDWIIPDFTWNYYGAAGSAQLQITLYYCNYPGDTIYTAGPYAVTQATTYVTTRLRGRYVAFRVESQDLGSFWRMGGLSFRIAPDGKR